MAWTAGLARRWSNASGGGGMRSPRPHFGEPGAMAAIYIDNHAKEVWSSLFTQSGKASHRNRVMPHHDDLRAHRGRDHSR